MELIISMHKTFFFLQIFILSQLIYYQKICTIFQKADILYKTGVFIYSNSIKNINSHIIMKGVFTI